MCREGGAPRLFITVRLVHKLSRNDPWELATCILLLFPVNTRLVVDFLVLLITCHPPRPIERSSQDYPSVAVALCKSRSGLAITSIRTAKQPEAFVSGA